MNYSPIIKTSDQRYIIEIPPLGTASINEISATDLKDIGDSLKKLGYSGSIWPSVRRHAVGKLYVNPALYSRDIDNKLWSVALCDRVEKLRAQALYAIQICDGGSINCLRKVISKDPSSWVRSRAVSKLGDFLKELTRTDAIEINLQDGPSKAPTIDLTDAITPLFEALSDIDSNVAYLAATYLSEIMNKGSSNTSEVLSNELCRVMIEFLPSVCSPIPRALLYNKLSDINLSYVQPAAIALKEIFLVANPNVEGIKIAFMILSNVQQCIIDDELEIIIPETYLKLDKKQRLEIARNIPDRIRSERFADVIVTMLHQEPDLKTRFRLSSRIAEYMPHEAAQVAVEVLCNSKVARSAGDTYISCGDYSFRAHFRDDAILRLEKILPTLSASEGRSILQKITDQKAARGLAEFLSKPAIELGARIGPGSESSVNEETIPAEQLFGRH